MTPPDRVAIDALQDRVEVGPGRDAAADVDLVTDLAGVVARWPGSRTPCERAPARHGQAHELERVVRPLALEDAGVSQRVPVDAHRLPGAEVGLAHGRVGARRRHADDEHDDREVHDVAAVAAPVAAHQVDQRPRPRAAGERAPGRRAAGELQHDGDGHEHAQRERRQPGGARPEPEQATAAPRRRAPRRPASGTCGRGCGRCAPPRDQRPDAGEGEQRQAEDDQEEVVVRASTPWRARRAPPRSGSGRRPPTAPRTRARAAAGC